MAFPKVAKTEKEIETYEKIDAVHVFKTVEMFQMKIKYLTDQLRH